MFLKFVILFENCILSIAFNIAYYSHGMFFETLRIEFVKRFTVW